MHHSTLLLSLFQYKAWANQELFTELQKLDAAVHAAERHTCIRLMNHIHVVDRIFVGHLSSVPHGFAGTNTPETPTMEALHGAVTATDQWYIEYVQALDAQRLAEPVGFDFTDGGQGCMSREEMLAHVITHGGYHRGAVGRIMAQLSIAPPRDIFTGFLHKTEPQRREHASSVVKHGYATQ